MLDGYSIKLSFRPRQAKLFPSRKRPLLVVECLCQEGSKNILNPGDVCLLHFRPTSMAPGWEHKNVESMATECLIREDSIPLLLRGTWASAFDDKLLEILTDQTIERNRKGMRVVEVQQLLRICDACDVDNQDVESDLDGDVDIAEAAAHQPADKSERHAIFAHWLISTYGKEFLSKGSGVLDVAGGNGEISRTLHSFGVPSTLLDPNPRCGEAPPFGVIPHALNGDGSDLTDRCDSVGETVRKCSFICGMHPDQATEPIVDLSLRLGVQFALMPCCVMPSLFPDRRQRRHNDPVRSYSAFCQYLLDMAPNDDNFHVGHLPFVGRNGHI